MRLRGLCSYLKKGLQYTVLIMLVILLGITLKVLDIQAERTPEKLTASSTALLAVATIILVVLNLSSLLQIQKDREEMQKDRQIRHIIEKLERLYYPIQQSGPGIFQDELVKKYFILRYLAHDELKRKLVEYRYNLNAPDLKDRFTEIQRIVEEKIPEIEEEYNRLIGS